MRRENDFYKVKIYIKNENELYNSFDKSETTLSDNLINYINNHIKLASAFQQLEFEIETETKMNEEKFYIAFEKTMENFIKIIQKKKYANIRERIGMCIIGIIFIVLSILLNSLIEDKVILELLSILGSFYIGQAAYDSLVVGKALRLKERQLNKIDRGKVKFNYI